MSDSENMTNAADPTTGSKPVKKKGKKHIVIGVILAIAVVTGIGLWNWHNQPSFCSTVCHSTMDSYVATYEAPASVVTTDKYGNEVENSNAMMAVTHREEGMNCLSCHEPTLSQQLGEVNKQLSGDYQVPLAEVSGEELMVNSGHDAGTGEQFCLRSGCHEESRDELTQATSSYSFNPHDWHHGIETCTDCHKSHRASVLTCTQCHEDAYASVPDGWVAE